MMTGCVSIVVMMLGSAGEGERTSDATDAHAGRRWFDDMGAAAAVRPRFVARRVDTAGVAGAAMREC